MEVLDLNYRREEFENILLKPDSFEWHKLYPNNVVPFHEDMEKHLHKGYYLLLFKRINRCRIDGSMMTIVFQKEQCNEAEYIPNAKIEAYNLFYHRFEDVRGPLEIPMNQDDDINMVKEMKDLSSGKLSCYCVNTRDEFIRSYRSLEKAKKGAMYWLKVRGGIDRKNVIPYGAIRNDVEEMKKKEVRENELYKIFITRYADVIETIKKYDYPGNAAGEVADILGITRDEVGFIYDLFDPTVFVALRLQTIEGK